MNGLTQGKLAGLKAVSDKRGVIAAVALDQRGMLRDKLGRELGVTDPSAAIAEFKQITARVIANEASAILLDLQYGLDAARAIKGTAGLLLAYEHAAYTPDHPERLPSIYEGWSVLRLKEAGATAVKILVYYNPYEDASINDRKKAWVERIGAECRANDIPLFLEFLGYDVHGEAETSIEYARRKPEIVMKSIEEFTRDRYGADVLKVDVPIQMAFVERTRAFQGHKLHSCSEAMEIIRAAGSLTDKPMVYLSAGVSNAVFVETLELAAESGVEFHGVLAGRAIWQDGVPIYARQGPAALEQWLKTTGLEYLRAVRRVLGAARPWHEARCMRT